MQFGGVCLSECGPLATYLIDLVANIYWSKPDPDDMSSDETELVEAAVDVLSSMMSQPYTHKYPTIVICNLSNIFDRFLKILDVERCKKDQNKDIVGLLYQLIIAIADTHSKLLINNLMSEKMQERELSVQTFNAILNCSDLPGMYPIDESSSTHTFGFWYTLQDDVFALDEYECARCLTVIKPLYKELTSALLRKSMLPSSDDDARWTLDDREVFRCYRQDIADTMVRLFFLKILRYDIQLFLQMYCYNVLGSTLLELLNKELNEAIAKCSDNNRIVSENWTYIEACLHAYFAIAESIDYENTYLPKLMLILKEIPYQQLHTKVLSTALDTVGAYAEWLSEHPEMLENIVVFLTSGLGNPEVAPSATMALKDITHNCQRYLGPFASHILHACQVI